MFVLVVQTEEFGGRCLEDNEIGGIVTIHELNAWWYKEGVRELAFIMRKLMVPLKS